MAGKRGVYQPSVPDTRIYAQIYMESALYSRDALLLAPSMYTHTAVNRTCPSFDLTFERPRSTQAWPYNSNAGTPLTGNSHTRYYFYTCDTASVPGDKGRECMTARMGLGGLVDEVRASISPGTRE